MAENIEVQEHTKLHHFFFSFFDIFKDFFLLLILPSLLYSLGHS